MHIKNKLQNLGLQHIKNYGMDGVELVVLICDQKYCLPYLHSGHQVGAQAIQNLMFSCNHYLYDSWTVTLLLEDHFF
jgi:hypothetical protein